MDTLNLNPSQPAIPETAAQRQRLAWEAAMIAEADARIDSIATDRELPVPTSGR
jgi:hypothetical protein